jgi:RNA polymerase sigma-70 factor, ECF subfamily
MHSLDGAFRREWGSAVATIAQWSGDLTVAEDAVQKACADAVRTRPRVRKPDNSPSHATRMGKMSYPLSQIMDCISLSRVRP